MATPRTQARRQKRRAEIVEAAQQLIASRGDDAFTTEELAAAADIGQASVFYYFPGGRAEIDTALALHRHWRLMGEWEAAAAQADDGVGALVALLRAVQRQYQRDPDVLHKTLDDMGRGPWPAELVAEHVAFVNAFYDRFEARLLEDRAAGKLHDDIGDLRRYTMLTIGQALGVLTHAGLIRAAGGTSKHTVAALFDDLVALVERAARKPKGVSPAPSARAAPRRRK